MCKWTDQLRDYPDNVLAEIVREGEANLEFQLARGAAIEQRAASLIASMFTAATVSFAGAISLYRNGESGAIVYLALAYGSVLLACGLGLTTTAGPTLRQPKGNAPDNWRPEHWPIPSGATYDLREARLAQCEVLQLGIEKNLQTTKILARRQRSLIYTALASSSMAGLAVSGLIVAAELKKTEAVATTLAPLSLTVHIETGQSHDLHRLIDIAPQAARSRSVSRSRLPPARNH